VNREFASLVAQRMRNQRIVQGSVCSASDVVSWAGAVQAQEFIPAMWGLGLRVGTHAVERELLRAFDEGRILRTHVMRPTWHFVTPRDIRWMLELTAPRVHRVMASYNRQMGLDPGVLTRAATLVEKALAAESPLSRPELGARLARAGLDFRGPHLAHIMLYAELERLICSGPRRGGRSTYVLLSDRALRAVRLSREESLAELARRYFRSHGPATLRDFMWWSGLAAADARQAAAMIRAKRVDIGGRAYWTSGPPPDGAALPTDAHLLPIYDEYLVAYRDRDAVPHGPSVLSAGARGYVTFQHALIIGGQVAGTWRTTRTKSTASVDVVPLKRLTHADKRLVDEAVRRYERFIEVPVVWRLAGLRSR
jgi:hypothetical protein